MTETAKEPLFFDSIGIIKELQENEFYTQILNFVCNSQNGMKYIAETAIIEEILATWGKEQWDEVINKIVIDLGEAHQEAKRQRMEAAKAVL